MSSGSLGGILAKLRKDSGNEYATLVDEGTIGDITSYTDTGCYILNAQLSADIYGGLPNGQIMTLAGESTCVTRDTEIDVIIE